MLHSILQLKVPEGVFQGRLSPDYPLAFEFDEIFRKAGCSTKAKVVEMVENIFKEYRVKELKLILERVVQKVL